MNEEWRPVIGFERHYSVSNLGRVRRDQSCRHSHVGLVMSPRTDKDGYRTVLLRAEGRHWYVPVHRLVADAFLGTRPAGAEVNHKDTVKSNNVASNLEYLTRAEHESHTVRHRLKCQGERHHNARLNPRRVRTIRKRLAAGWTQARIAERFGVNQTSISKIDRRVTWKHV